MKKLSIILIILLLTGCTSTTISNYPMPWGDSTIDSHGIMTEVFGGFGPEGGFEIE